jgi:hypothetical protein
MVESRQAAPSPDPQPIGQPSHHGLETHAAAYLLQDAHLLNERVRWYLEEQDKLETLGLVASGAIWAFAVSLTWSPALSYLVWVPAIISFALFIKSLLLTAALKEAFDYIYRIEELYRLPAGTGWVHHFRKTGKRVKRRWRAAFWSLLVTGNVMIALFAPLRELLPPPNEAPPTAQGD